MTAWGDVALALVTRWPTRQWPEEVVAGYVRELQAEGLSAEQALAGLRAHRGSFPPSVGEVTDAVAPAGIGAADAWALVEEAVRRVGCSPHSAEFEARHQAAVDWIAERDRPTAAWAARRGLCGPGSLGWEPVGDPEFGGAVRHRLAQELAEVAAQARRRQLGGGEAVPDRMLRVGGGSFGGVGELAERLRPAAGLPSGGGGA